MRTVDTAARDRLERVFADFDNVIVAFSGGKDSGALLHLVLDHLRARRVHRPVHVFHLDYEAQYTATTQYVTEQMTGHRDLLVPWRVCLPVTAASAASTFTDHWRPWDPVARELWVRDLPEHDGVVHAGTVPDGFPRFEGVWDHVFQDAFARWHHAHHRARRTAVLIGIRQQESLQRYAAINRADKHAMHDGLRWTSVLAPGVVKAYPIHDWQLSDVWHAHARFGWPYNRLYDLLHTAGVPAHQMRVASPFISQGIGQLRLYRVIEPDLWQRLAGRVAGANFAAVHGRSRAMAAKDVVLPAGHTWHSYLMFLLDTLPAVTRERYRAKFAASVRYWTDKGGALPVETVRQLRAARVAAEYLGAPRTKRRYSRPHEIVRFTAYPDDLPGVRDFALLPTYKRMCLAILRNDHTCRSLGFGPTRSERDRREAALARYQGVSA